MEEMAKYLTEQAAIAEQIKNVGKDKESEKVSGELTQLEEDNLRKQMQEMGKTINRHKKNLKSSAASVVDHEAAFKQLKEASGIQDIHKLVQRYVTQEDEIFSLYNYIQGVNQDIAQMEKSLTATQDKMKEVYEELGLSAGMAGMGDKPPGQ